MNIIKGLIESDASFDERTQIQVPDFVALGGTCVARTWYLFNNNFYTQADGVAMGGPASLVAAEI